MSLHINHPVLIIGGGFIGSALALDFTKRGRIVSVVTRHQPLQAIHGVRYFIGDQADTKLLGPLLADSPDILHVACGTTPGKSARDPLMETEENLLPLSRFLRALQDQPIPRQLVYFSSGGTVYGNPGILPVPESHRLEPLSYYGASKVAAESLVSAFASQFGWSLSIIRPSNIYGPGQPHLQGFGIIPAMFSHIKSGTPLIVWGDGNACRDYLYIEDIISACHLLTEGRTEGIFNVGSGIQTSICNLAELICDITQQELKLEFRASRRVDVQKIVLDVTRLIECTGWKHQISLEDGLLNTWEWICRTSSH